MYKCLLNRTRNQKEILVIEFQASTNIDLTICCQVDQLKPICNYGLSNVKF